MLKYNIFYDITLRNNRVIIILFFFLLISICFSIYRHSPHCILMVIKLEMLEHDRSLMFYKIIRWFLPYFHFSHIRLLLLLYTQTLTTLDVGFTRIGNAGTQYLANVLRNNTVILILFFIPRIFIFSSAHRHSLHCTLTAIKLDMLEHNHSLMSFEITRWFSSYFHSLHIQLLFYA
jgi:hypothetical protein